MNWKAFLFTLLLASPCLAAGSGGNLGGEEGAGGGPPVTWNFPYVTCANDSRLSNESVITAGTGILVNCSGGAATISATGSGTSIDVRSSGTLIGTRPSINLIPGTNVSLSVTDDAANNRVNISITSSGAGSGTVVTEIPCSGNITTALQTAISAGEPVLIGPGACTATSPITYAGQVIAIRGVNIRETQLTMSDPAGTSCAFEFQSVAGTGFSQSIVEDIRIVFTGTGNNGFCINGFSNGAVFERVDLRNGLDQINITPAPADNSLCFRCYFHTIFSFAAGGRILRLDGTGSSIMLLHIENWDVHSPNWPFIEIDGIRDEESQAVLISNHFDNDASAAAPAILCTNCGDTPFVVMGGNILAPNSAGWDFIEANSNLAVTSFGFNTRGNPATPVIECAQFIDYVSPATNADVACASSPSAGTNQGRPVVVNGVTLTVP